MKIKLLKLEMSRKCSFKCKYCFAIKDKKNKISKRFFKNFQDLLIGAKKLGLKRVILTGGEPILEKETCLKIITICKEINIETEIYTNGFSLNKRLIDEIYEKGCKTLRFTFLTTNNKNYMKISKVNNKNLVAIITNNILYAKQKGFYVKVGVTPLLKSELCGAKKTLNFLISLNVDQIELSGMRYCKNSWNYEQLSRKDLLFLYGYVKKIKKIKPKIFFYRCEGHKVNFKKQDILPFSCGIDYLSIDGFTGNIYPSTMVHIKLGNLLDEDFNFEMFWKNNTILKEFRAFFKHNKRTCSLLHKYKCA